MRAVLQPSMEPKVLPEDESRRLLRLLRQTGFGVVLRSYAAREVITAEEDRTAALYVLTWGIAFLLRDYSPRREAALGLLTEGDIFGNLELAQKGSVRGNLVQAVTRCKVAKVPRPVLAAAVRRNPLVGLTLVNLREVQLCRYEEFVDLILSRKTVVRLAQVLLNLSERFPEVSPGADGAIVIAARFTQEDLALMVASTRESVCAALRELRKKGVVDVRSGILTVLEPEQLREVAGGQSGPEPEIVRS